MHGQSGQCDAGVHSSVFSVKQWKTHSSAVYVKDPLTCKVANSDEFLESWDQVV